ncbi:MAG: hypothetical protein COA42_09230 [Alteromonadaceae bacterium]|nr:MAG: hypothetical protein COA42_09230 [Alteromonadaceae bacterium]
MQGLSPSGNPRQAIKATMKTTSEFILKVTLVTTALLGLAVFSYQGTYKGEESSPNKRFFLRYYQLPTPYKFIIGSTESGNCKPMLVKLYNNQGDKLNTLHTSSCLFKNKATWLPNKVILPDGETVWPHASK